MIQALGFQVEIWQFVYTSIKNTIFVFLVFISTF